MPRAIAAALVAVGVAIAFSACGGNGHQKKSTPAPAPAPTPAAPAKPAPTEIAPKGGLAIGLTELNPGLFTHGEDVGAFGPWRDRVEALKPPLYRLTVDWSVLQPTPDAPVDWTKATDGCMRGIAPCRPYAGIRDTLRAIRSEQQAGNGFATMVVIYGVPPWAARSAHGCERPGIGTRSRPITAAGFAAYRRLVSSLEDLAQRERVDIGWWSPWNEPNGPFFISPQRASCKSGSKPLSPALYTRFARAMRDELKPGQQLVVGELAGFKTARRYGTSISEFFDALPDDVVCNAGVFAQHAYAKRSDAPNDRGSVGVLEDVLDRRPCTAGKPIWITETGVGGPHVGDVRTASEKSIRLDCRALAATLSRWNDDPRVQAAFQYTFRDDPVFPVGLADVGLTRTWPAYDLFKAWGGDRHPDDPAPALPQACTG
ncbi:MAG: hypothetical protein QOJ82_4128 [Solirubrobacteraceae bacterium]|nr:hypothetical protein [Solirubrobacteraceae bacterium]